GADAPRLVARGPDRARWAQPHRARPAAGAGAQAMTKGDGASAPRHPYVLGIRRVQELEPDAPLPASNPKLVGRIADEIRGRGPMPFARFMELALYDPTAGYYTGAAGGAGAEIGPWAATGPGRGGDFLTAPEGHPIFGWAIARHLESAWKAIGHPPRFVVREHGAGSGALAAGILDGLRRSGSALLDAIEYQAADIAPARLDALAARLAAVGLDRHLAPPDDAPAAGVVLANELLDALPVHRVEGGADSALLERFVILAAEAGEQTGGGGLSPFATELGPPSTPALADRLAAEGIELAAGQAAEICLVLDRW